MTHEYHLIIDACIACAKACEQCANASTLAPVNVLATDTALVCRLTADLLRRHSEFAEQVGQACAAVCERYADECERQASAACRDSGAAARHCGEQCRRMAAGYLGKKYEAPTGGAYAG